MADFVVDAVAFVAEVAGLVDSDCFAVVAEVLAVVVGFFEVVGRVVVGFEDVLVVVTVTVVVPPLPPEPRLLLPLLPSGLLVTPK